MRENVIDRGMKKWTAMMLPEHVDMLREWQAEDTYTPRPILSEWQLEELQQTVVEAYVTQKNVMITVWIDGQEKQYQGIIKKLNPIKQQLHIQSSSIMDTIYVEQIIRVDL